MLACNWWHHFVWILLLLFNGYLLHQLERKMKKFHHGGAQLQCIYYLVPYSDLQAAKGISAFQTSLLLPGPYHRIFMKVTLSIYSMQFLWHVCIQFKRSKAKVTRVVPSFCHVPALWLHAYSTDLLHIWHKYNPWGGDVLCTISR